MAVTLTQRNTLGICGPGGLNCSCCSDWNPRKHLRKVRRAVRRAQRQADQREWRREL